MPRPQREIPWAEIRNGHWYVFWYNADTRRTERLSLRTTDAGEAQDRYLAFLSEGRSLLRRPPNAGVTVREILDSYLREHVGRDPDTGEDIPGVTGVADRYRQCIAAKRLRDFWEDTPVSSIDIPESRRYALARSLMQPAAGPSTVRRELNVLTAAANHAVRWKRLSKEQIPLVELPPHAPVEEAAFLSKDEVRRAITAAAGLPDPRPHAFIVLAYLTGARRKSLERLQRSQVDLDRMRLSLTPAGKRQTKKRAPIVPINAEMAVELRKIILRAGDSPWLFGSPGYDVYPPFREICAAAGINAARSFPHILRHSRATHMLQDGAPIWDVAKLLGDTVATVERVYGHHCPSYMAGSDAFGSLGAVLG